MSTRPVDLIESGEAGAALREAEVEDGRIEDAVALRRRSPSRNRLYTEDALADAADLLPGTNVYLDHDTGTRSVHDLAGRVVEARVADGEVRVDVESLDREPSKSLLTALAEQAPGAARLAARARGEVRVRDDGTEVVEEVTEVRGLDVVANETSQAEASLFEQICVGCTLVDDGMARLRDECIDPRLLKAARPVLEHASRKGPEAVKQAVVETLQLDNGTYGGNDGSWLGPGTSDSIFQESGGGGSRRSAEPRSRPVSFERDPDDVIRGNGDGSGSGGIDFGRSDEMFG